MMTTADLLAVSIGVNAVLTLSLAVAIAVAAWGWARAKSADSTAVHELRSEQARIIAKLDSITAALDELRDGRDG